MRAQEITVNVVDFGGELFVTTTMKLKGVSLYKEKIEGTSNHRTSEKARRVKAKEIKSYLQAVEFPDYNLIDNKS